MIQGKFYGQNQINLEMMAERYLFKIPNIFN